MGGERGFEMLEVACWPAATGPARRYAGVCHIDVDDLDPTPSARRWPPRPRDLLAAYYPNNLAGDDAAREEANAHLRKVIDAAARSRSASWAFVGADQTLPLPENLQRFRSVWPPSSSTRRSAA